MDMKHNYAPTRETFHKFLMCCHVKYKLVLKGLEMREGAVLIPAPNHFHVRSRIREEGL